MHAKTLPSYIKKVHTNSEYILFKTCLSIDLSIGLLLLLALQEVNMSPSCHWTCNFNDLTDTEYGNDADPLYQQSSIPPLASYSHYFYYTTYIQISVLYIQGLDTK